jgi:hypothetical protein
LYAIIMPSSHQLAVNFVEEKCFAHKNRIALQPFSPDQVSNTVARQLFPMNSIWLTGCCAICCLCTLFSSSAIYSVVSVLRQVHSLFQTDFSTQCDRASPRLISNIPTCPEGHPWAVYVFFLDFP